MIGLAKACDGGGRLFNYVIDYNKGYELCRNLLCGKTPKELFEEIKIIQELNQRAVNKTFSLVLSPDISDSKNLSDLDLVAMTQEYLNRLEIDTQEQQYIAFVHTEKQHLHIHIICNRVKLNGKLISDKHIGKRAQWAAHKMATNKGLISAKQLMIDKIKNTTIESATENKNNSVKEQIFQKHLKTVQNHLDSFQSYKEMMLKEGIIVKPTINNQGSVQGYRFVDIASNEDYKASDINRKMKLNEIGKSKTEALQINKIEIKLTKKPKPKLR